MPSAIERQFFCGTPLASQAMGRRADRVQVSRDTKSPSTPKSNPKPRGMKPHRGLFKPGGLQALPAGQQDADFDRGGTLAMHQMQGSDDCRAERGFLFGAKKNNTLYLRLSYNSSRVVEAGRLKPILELNSKYDVGNCRKS
jgi:hypothetical protein